MFDLLNYLKNKNSDIKMIHDFVIKHLITNSFVFLNTYYLAFVHIFIFFKTTSLDNL